MHRADYATDLGVFYHFVSLMAEDFFLPEIFKRNATKGDGFCALPSTVQPRRAILFDTEGREHRIEYPFRPGSPEWFEFWREIDENPAIISSRSIGEVVQLNLRRF